MATERKVLVACFALIVAISWTSALLCEPCETEPECFDTDALPNKQTCISYKTKCPEPDPQCKEWRDDLCGCCTVCAKGVGEECLETSECESGLFCDIDGDYARCLPEMEDDSNLGTTEYNWQVDEERVAERLEDNMETTTENAKQLLKRLFQEY